jgi:F-type H+-transporting ATPase subunit b|tara:strand:- start:2507 stop:3037 length:531 start_codon:yes stop_codon:yes gene_type:complete
MENLINTSILLSDKGFTLNTDIFETNIINIILLVVILFKVLGDALKTSLVNRKQKIIEDVNDAKKRLSNAKERLSEANTQLTQTKIAINKIQEEASITKRNFIKNYANRVLKDMINQIKTSALTGQLDRQRLVDLTTYLVATSAVKCVVKKIENEFSLEQHVALIDKNVDRLPYEI